MATFLVRAHRFVTGETLPLDDRWFRDRDPVHRDNVDRAASAGIAPGFSNGTFRPPLDVRRAQMASFLLRLAPLLVDERHPTPPHSPPAAPPPPTHLAGPHA